MADRNGLTITLTLLIVTSTILYAGVEIRQAAPSDQASSAEGEVVCAGVLGCGAELPSLTGVGVLAIVAIGIIAANYATQRWGKQDNPSRDW